MQNNLLIVLGICLTLVTNLKAQSWEQKGLDIEGEMARDFFGAAVSLSKDGSILAVGGSWNDANGENSGYVRVYEYNNNEEWSQIGENINGEAEGDRFGGALSLSDDGSILAVGARLNDAKETDSGHVRVYALNKENNSWEQIGQDLEGESNSSFFGISVSLSSNGKVLAVGAEHNEGVNGFLSGHVQIFVYNEQTNTWDQLGHEIDGESSGDFSGGSVSLSDDGNIVAIGARSNDGNGTAAGHTRIFQYNLNENTWDQLGSDIDGAALGDNSGISVSLSNDGSKIAIGSTLNDNENGNAAGHVRVFEYRSNNNEWQQLGSNINGEAAFDRFGGKVSLSGDGKVVAASARLSDENGTDTGHVRIFEYNPDIDYWEQIDVDIDGDNAYDNFGISISLSDDGKSIAIGSDQSTHPFERTQTGYVKVFEFDDGVTLSEDEINLDEESFKIFPNPTVEALHISFSELTIEKTSIFNIYGALVWCNYFNASEINIPVKSLATGNYILKIKTNKGETSKLFIKE